MIIKVLIVLVAGLAPLRSPAADWPMWRFDVGRTAESPQRLAADMVLLWERRLPKPRPAFDDVRLQFDAGYEPVVMGRRLFLSSNCEDSVTAFDTATGGQLWRFFADGPVRHAPVAWNNRVLFGSDDGRFYCLSAETGEPVWTFEGVPSGRKVLGNGRLTSVWPVRGGPVLKDGRVYFAAGVWPFEGVFIFCLDAATGRRIWVNDSTGHLYGQQPHNAVAIGGIAPQGYLLIDGDDLVVPSSNAYPGRFDLKTGALRDFKLPLGGRFPGGWYASLPGTAELKKTKRKSLLADIGINVVRHEDRLRSEGHPGIRTTIRAGGREFRFGDGHPKVAGRIHSMIAADDKLFVTTVDGGLYAFGQSNDAVPRRHHPESADRPGSTALSTKLIATIPHHGYAVFLGAPDAPTLDALVARTELQLIVVDSDPVLVDQLRRRFVRSGTYGSRVTLSRADPATFEMPPFFANLVFVRQGIVPDSRDRVFNSVRPYGGQFIVQTGLGFQVTTRTGALPGSTNYAGDFSASPDELAKAPFGILWFDDTLGHFKRSPQPQFIDGVMVSMTKDWIDAERKPGPVDYRLLPPTYSDVYTGRIFGVEEVQDLPKRPWDTMDLEKLQPRQYRPPTQQDHWKPAAPTAGQRRNPLTGELEPREFPKSYGCDGGFDYGHIYTMRSGTAAFYDKRIESGTINISGPRSGCTNSIIPANGLLNLPYFYKGCTCSYPLPTGLALYSLPESHEQWTTWGAVAAEEIAGKIQRVGINFGAPADRMTESGTLWLEYPGVGGPSPEIAIETMPAKPESYYHHSVWMEGGDALPWVAASGVRNLESVTIKGLRPGPYQVVLTFSNPSGEKARCDLFLQGRLAAKGFTSGERMIGVIRSFADIESAGQIKLDLVPQSGSTQLSGIEIISMDLLP